MRIERAELRLVSLPLRYPFETSFGRESLKHCVLVRLDCEGVTGWGECVAMHGPWYSEETTGTAWHVLSEHLLPLVLGQDVESAEQLLSLVARVRGNNMARAALEMAFTDALARAQGISLSRLLGGTRTEIACGVSIGIQPSPGALARTIERELTAGYQRVKLKIKPGADMEYVREARTTFPDTPLMVDANSAYRLEDAPLLASLDAYNLMMIEQPLAHDDIVDHASLAPRLHSPLCLDESLHSVADVRQALGLGSCRIVNIKAGRMGGLAESVRAHDHCLGLGAPVWCGGMLETNVGRAHNVALSSLSGFTLPGDVSASERYFERDIAGPDFVLTAEGTIHVPEGPGTGVEIDPARLDEVTARTEEYRGHG